MKTITFILSTLLTLSASASSLSDFQGNYITQNCYNTSGFKYIEVGVGNNKKTVDYDLHVKTYNNKELKIIEISATELHIYSKRNGQ